MESINDIKKGVNTDFDIHAQPAGTLRGSVNGRINATASGIYSWSPLKGNTILYNVTGGLKIIAMCNIRNTLYFLLWHSSSGTVYLTSAGVNSSATAITTPTTIATYTGGVFGYNPLHPIRAFWGYYENEDIQRLYLTDYNNKPKVIDVNNPAAIKFLDFTPVQDSLGEFSFQDIVSGGNLYYGAYFVAFRLYTADGYYTDWSFHSNPINVTKSGRGTTPDNYHDYTGGASTMNSGNKIDIDITNLDTDYDYIQLAYFRSTAYNVIEPGIIAYDTELSTSTMSFNIIGGETVGTLNIDDLILTSITIMKCKDMIPIKNYNTIVNIEEREELDIPSTLGGTVEEEITEVVLDMRSGVDPTTNAPVVGMYPNNTAGLLFAGMWYRADSAVSYTTIDGTAESWNTNDRFQPADMVVFYTGTVTPLIRIKKYRYGTATPAYTDSDYEWEEIEIDGMFPNYKDPIIAHYMKGYAGNITVRVGVVFFDLEGRPFFARHLADYTTSDRDSVGFTANYSSYTSAEGVDYYQTNGNIISLKASDIDITDFYDKISGFSIVRCVIPDHKIGTGVLIPIDNYSGTEYRTWPGMWGTFTASSRKENAYVLYSPEHLYGLNTPVIGDKIKNISYLYPYRGTATRYTTWQGYGVLDYNNTPGSINYRYLHQKFYIRSSVTATGNGARNSENKLREITNYEFTDDDVVFDSANPTHTFGNNLMQPAAGMSGRNPNLLIVMTENDENSGADPNYVGTLAANSPRALIVDLIRDAIGYGGTDSANLATMQYITVGHFQPVNASVLSDINDGSGNYIFNEVQFYGGDHYVCLFGLNRAIADHNDTNPVNHSIIIPLETKLNLALRQGRKFEQLQTYDSGAITDGLYYDSSVPTINIEEFILNSAYSTNQIGDIYPGLPYNTSLQNKSDVMARYSSHKVNGEFQDSFRIFRTLNYREVDPRFGPINNIRANGNYLVFWQDDSIGYIPISERQMAAGEFGQPVQMGVGNMFEIDDSITHMLGNSHQFGLVEFPEGYMWFDARRKFMIKMNRSLKITLDSILTGYKKDLDDNYYHGLLGEDNPLHSHGISSGYEPETGIVIVNMKYTDHNQAYLFDAISGLYMGTTENRGVGYFSYRDLLLSINPSTIEEVWVNNRGNYRSFYGTVYDAEFTVVVKNDSSLSMKFDNIIMTGNDKNIDKIKYENYDGSVTEIITNSAGTLISRDYERIRNELRGSIALINGTRFDGPWLKVTFYVSGTRNELVSFFQLLTKYRHGW